MSRLNDPFRTRRPIGELLLYLLIAVGLFVCVVYLLGGPSLADSSESVYSALLISHGNWACAYPPLAFSQVNGTPLVLTSPVYVLVSGTLASLLGFGATTAFPSIAIMGADCSHAFTLTSSWAQSTGVLTSMMRLGFVSWVVLVVGLISTMRASGKGHDGVEIVAVLTVLCSPPVFSSLVFTFHPEDVLAMGLVLLAVANVFGRKWFLVGALMALGVTTQLFALLALIPLAAVIPRGRRGAFTLGFTSVLTAVVAPLTFLTSGRVLHSVFLGTSKAGERTISAGGTILYSANLHGIPLFLISRISPLVAASVLSFLVVRRWGAAAREPVLLVALVGSCLAMRLVFEVNAFEYYYLATVVSLILLDSLRGRFRGMTFTLIGLITVAFGPAVIYLHWGGQLLGPSLRPLLPYVFLIVSTIFLVAGLVRRQVTWYLVASIVLVSLAFLRIPLQTDYYKGAFPLWFWQVALVTPLVYSLSAPLRGSASTSVAIMSTESGVSTS